MTKTLLLSILLLLGATVASAADEPDTRTPIERYRGDTAYAITLCKLNLRMALSASQLSEPPAEKIDYPGCIEDGKKKTKQSLSKALRSIKKPKAQEALKTYHVAVVTALDGIRPGPEERKISYDQRQQALDDKMNEAWARFEIEQ